MIAKYISPDGPFGRVSVVAVEQTLLIRVGVNIYMFKNPANTPHESVEVEIMSQSTPEEIFEAMEIHALKQMSDDRQTI